MKLSDFAKRHENLLTTIAALVVFLGFITKEAVRENVKDLEGALDRATDNYARGLDTLRVRTEILSLYSNQSSGAFRERADIGRYARMTVEHDFEATEDILANEANLAGHLPRRSKEADGELSSLRTKVQALKLRYSDLMDDRVSQSSSDRILTEAAQFRDQVVPLDDEVRSFRQRLSTEAHLQEEELRNTLRMVTYLEYVLFTIGWGLGLFSKLIGLEKVAESTESPE